MAGGGDDDDNKSDEMDHRSGGGDDDSSDLLVTSAADHFYFSDESTSPPPPPPATAPSESNTVTVIVDAPDDENADLSATTAGASPPANVNDSLQLPPDAEGLDMEPDPNQEYYYPPGTLGRVPFSNVYDQDGGGSVSSINSSVHNGNTYYQPKLRILGHAVAQHGTLSTHHPESNSSQGEGMSDIMTVEESVRATPMAPLERVEPQVSSQPLLRLWAVPTTATAPSSAPADAALLQLSSPQAVSDISQSFLTHDLPEDNTTSTTPAAAAPRKTLSDDDDDAPLSAMEGALSEQPGNDNMSSRASSSCWPSWVRRAPVWLRILLLASLVLLLMAILLVGVGLGMAFSNDKANTSSSGQEDSPTAPSSTRAPTTVVPVPVAPMVPGTSPAPVTVSTAAPSPAPLSTTPRPTFAYNPDVITVYATGGAWDSTQAAALPSLLATLPAYQRNAVLFHLGDWNNDPTDTTAMCDEGAYQNVTALFASSSVPVYFVVGDNEYNDCADPTQALEFWKKHLVNYETTNWPPPSWTVWRQGGGYNENFAFRQQNVIFVGLNLVSGTVQDGVEWSARMEADRDWVDSNYYFYVEDDVDTMVLLVHAAPGISSVSPFFDNVLDSIAYDYVDMDFVMVHRNLISQSAGMVDAYNGIRNLKMVTVEGSVWPPMEIQINTRRGPGSPDDVVQVNQGDWYDIKVPGGAGP